MPFSEDLGLPTTALGTIIVGNMAMLSLLGWIVKVLISKTIPEMSTTFAKLLTEQHSTEAKEAAGQQMVYQQQLDQIRAYAKEDRDLFRAEMKDQRDLFERTLDKFIKEKSP